MERDKNWLSSLKSFTFGKQKRAQGSTSEDNDVVLRRNHPTNSEESPTTCSKTRSSFRRSFIKLQNRMKSAVSRNRPASRHTIHSAGANGLEVASRPSGGVVASGWSTGDLGSMHQASSRPAENLYSMDPVERTQRMSFVEMAGPPALPVRNMDRQNVRVPTDEIQTLSNCYWYWGPLSKAQAEEKLSSCTNGAFLIRDSTSSSYLFTLSFRSSGRTLHSRIEHSGGQYSLYDQEGYASIRDLIDNAMQVSRHSIFCYTKTVDFSPNFPVRLTKPISRFTSVRTLKYLCRFVIRQCTNINDLPHLGLPQLLTDYLQEEGPYF